MSIGLTTATVFSLLPVNGGGGDLLLLAGTNGGGIFISTNHGSSWHAGNTGLTNMIVTTLAASGSKLFAGTKGGGIFSSIDDGETWSPADSGLTNNTVWTIAGVGDHLFAATGGGVFHSIDNGTTWNAVNSGLPSTAASTLAIFTTGNGDTTLYSAVYGGLFRSTNFGTTGPTVGLAKSLRRWIRHILPGWFLIVPLSPEPVVAAYSFPLTAERIGFRQALATVAVTSIPSWHTPTESGSRNLLLERTTTFFDRPIVAALGLAGSQSTVGSCAVFRIKRYNCLPVPPTAVSIVSSNSGQRLALGEPWLGRLYSPHPLRQKLHHLRLRDLRCECRCRDSRRRVLFRRQRSNMEWSQQWSA